MRSRGRKTKLSTSCHCPSRSRLKKGPGPVMGITEPANFMALPYQYIRQSGTNTTARARCCATKCRTLLISLSGGCAQFYPSSAAQS